MRPRHLLTLLLLEILFSIPISSPHAQPASPPPAPALAPKPYRIAIAPPHIAESPAGLFEKPDDWKEVRSSVQLYKYYGVQLQNIEWARPLDPKAFATMIRQNHLQAGCEFGGFPILGGGKEAAGAVEVLERELKPMLDQGIEISSLHLDDPIARLLKGADPKDGLPLDDVVAAIVGFWKETRKKYPSMKIGLITNLPNWDYSKDQPGDRGQRSRGSGFTYEELLEKVQTALKKEGLGIEFLEVDCPYHYYTATKSLVTKVPVDYPKMLKTIQAWCGSQKAAFHLVVNAEPQKRGAAGFHEGTLSYVKRLRQDGIFPDLFIFQSWYEQPRQMLPETQPGTFMNTALEAIRLVHQLYPPPPGK